MNKILKYIFFLIIFTLLSCTGNKQNISDKNTNSKQKENEQRSEPLILGGKPYIDFHGKAYSRDEAELFTSIVYDFRLDSKMQLYNLEGLEQLTNLKGLSIYGNNLDVIDFTPLSSLHKLEELFIKGNITLLPDLTKLEYLSYIVIENARLKSLEGIGAPNARKIEIYNPVVEINSLAPLNNLLNLEDLKITSNSAPLRITNISNLPSLKKLQLDITEIDLQSIENLPSLEELWLSDSKLYNIEGIGKLINLRRLSLQLSSSEPSLEFLQNMSNLSWLSIAANNNRSYSDKFIPYQVLDVSPLALLRNLKQLNCTDFIIKNIAALDTLDALNEISGHIYLAGCRLFNEKDKSKHTLVLEYSTRE